jgi:hypothetical protein
METLSLPPVKQTPFPKKCEVTSKHKSDKNYITNVSAEI